MLTPFINNFAIFYPLKLRLEAYSFGLNRNEIKNIFEYELMHLLLIMKSTPEIFQECIYQPFSKHFYHFYIRIENLYRCLATHSHNIVNFYIHCTSYKDTHR